MASKYDARSYGGVAGSSGSVPLAGTKANLSDARSYGRAVQNAHYASPGGERGTTLSASAEPAAWYARTTLPRAIGVVVPTRNRPHLLPHMLGSLMLQTHRPGRILVVDDGDDETLAEEVARRYPGVEYCRASVGSGLSGNPARNVGLRALGDLPYLCFLDDDDMIPPDYLEVLLSTIEGDCRAAAAYPRLRFCGADKDTWDFPYDPDQLGRSNLSGVPALIRTDALLQVGGWPVFSEGPGGAIPHDDWALWKRLRNHGWQMVPAPVDYYYYRHEEPGVCRSKAGEGVVEGDWRRTVDPTDLVTLAIPFSGRGELLGPLLDAIARQTFPVSHLHVIFYDNSGSEVFGRRLREWLLDHDEIASHCYVRDPRRAIEELSARELADAPLDETGQGRRRFGRELNHRIGAIWNRIGRLVRTDLVWCLEDDVIPPADALDRLLDRMAPEVDGVTANYPSRVVPGYSVAWNYDDLETGAMTCLGDGSGVQAIGGTGLGCALVRREVFDAGPARSAGDAIGYDCNLWLDVARRGGTLLIDWDLRCEHRFAPGIGGGPGDTRNPRRVPGDPGRADPARDEVLEVLEIE